MSELLRQRVMPNSTLAGEANLLVFPNLDAANIALGLVKTMTEALHVGPILLGAALPAHILSPSVTSRGVVKHGDAGRWSRPPHPTEPAFCRGPVGDPG